MTRQIRSLTDLNFQAHPMETAWCIRKSTGIEITQTWGQFFVPPLANGMPWVNHVKTAYFWISLPATQDYRFCQAILLRTWYIQSLDKLKNSIISTESWDLLLVCSLLVLVLSHVLIYQVFTSQVIWGKQESHLSIYVQLTAGHWVWQDQDAASRGLHLSSIIFHRNELLFHK